MRTPTSFFVCSRLAAALLLLDLAACVMPFGARPQLLGPPSLRVDFDSAAATARLTWERPPLRDFVRYEVERRGRHGFEVITEIADGSDTTWSDDRLLASREYRYRVTSVFSAGKGEAGNEQRLQSTTVSGGIHRHVNTWRLSPGFRPTRIAISADGILHVLGAGGGWIERFDRGGNPMGSWRYTDLPNACLETATLDAPAAAFDAEGSLFVVFNTYVEGGAPRPQWAKIAGDGTVRWTRPLRTVFARHIAVDGERVFIESISQLQQFRTDGEFVEHYTVPPLMVSSVRFWQGSFAALVEPLGFDTAGWQAPRLVRYGSVERDDVESVAGRDPLSPEDHGAGLLNRPTDFVPDTATGRVFVVNGGYDRIEVFRDGRYLTRWGELGGDAAAFRFRGRAVVLTDVTSGTLVEKEVVAGGIARDADGYIYVADTFNDRVQKFAP